MAYFAAKCSSNQSFQALFQKLYCSVETLHLLSLSFSNELNGRVILQRQGIWPWSRTIAIDVDQMGFIIWQPFWFPTRRSFKEGEEEWQQCPTLQGRAGVWELGCTHGTGGGGASLMQGGELGFLGQIWWRLAVVQEQWTTWCWKTLTKRLEGIPTSSSQISVFVYSSARLLSCKERNVNPGWVAREFRFYLLLFWLEGNKGGAPTCKTLFCVKSVFE